MDISEIEADITATENDVLIYDEQNFDRRATAIDFIDFHILDRIQCLQQSSADVLQLKFLEQRAQKLKLQLEDIDIKLFKRLREDIRSAIPFKDIISKYFDSGEITKQPNEPGYDNLDNFINGLLCCQPLPEASLSCDAEMVFYQQTPARIIFQQAEMARLKPGDIFYDIGSGLGHVGMLVNLLTGAKTTGIEYEPAYCKYAKACASQLNLTDVQFINTDARNADYSSGSVFFMYTPFQGNMLQQMLNLLQQQAKQRLIRIFTYGPCSSAVARQPLLECINGDGVGLYTLYEFRSFERKSI